MNRLHRIICRSEGWRKRLESQYVPWVLENVDLGGELLEIGPGPGGMTNVLSGPARRVTCVEIDPEMTEALRRRTAGAPVRIVNADATALPFEHSSFSGAVCFTMLHHVLSRELQDCLLAEVRRVLRPGGVFAGMDYRPHPAVRVAHWFDTYVPVDPAEFPRRLKAAGFDEISINTQGRLFRFSATRTQAA